MYGFERLADAMVAAGIDTVFGLVGDANLCIVQRLTEHHDVRFVSTSHEADAVAMADGYARATGRLGVATVTHGPGLTNTVTPLVEAVKHGTPLLLVAGDTATEDRFTGQDVFQRGLVEVTGAGFEAVRSPASAAHDLVVAARRAQRERRPIVVNAPLEILYGTADQTNGALGTASWVPNLSAWRSPALAPDPDELDRVMGIVASAARPLLVAGGGAAGAGAEITALAQRLGAPLFTTVKGKGTFAPREHLGIFGSLASPVGVDAIAESDVLVFFGAGLNRWTTLEGSLLEGKAVVQVDVDARSLEQHFPVAATMQADARQAAVAMCAALDAVEHRPASFADRHLPDPDGVRAAEVPVGDDHGFNRFLVEANRFLPADRIVSVDTGRFMVGPMALLDVPDPRSFVFPATFASIGLAVGAAVGAAVGNPGRPSVAVIGDGGFMMGGLGPFQAAVRAALDLVVIVLDDGCYGAEHMTLRARGHAVDLSLCDWPDLVSVARSLGGDAVAVSSLDDLPAAEHAVHHRSRPLLIDVRVDPDAVPAIGGRPRDRHA